MLQSFFLFILVLLALTRSGTYLHRFVDKEFCKYNKNEKCSNINKISDNNQKCILLQNNFADLCAIPYLLVETHRSELSNLHNDAPPEMLCYSYRDNDNKMVIYDKWCKGFMNGKCIYDSNVKDYICKFDPITLAESDKDEKRDITVLEYGYRSEEYKYNLLIAIDGTSSKEHFKDDDIYKQKYISSDPNKDWIWQSHVWNFAQDYLGLSLYWNGPDAVEMVSAGWEVGDIVDSANDKVCEFVKNSTVDNKEYFIDIIGFSRGGYAAVKLGKQLKKKGCKDLSISKINVRFLGLYDPVKKTYELTEIRSTINEVIDMFNVDEKHTITSNVKNAVVVKRDPNTWSRKSFGYLIEDTSKEYFEDKNTCKTDSNNYKCVRTVVGTSHSGVGGSPGYGDCKDDCGWDPFCLRCHTLGKYSEKEDKEGSLITDVWIRSRANQIGVPIKITNRQYYAIDNSDNGQIFVLYKERLQKEEL